MHQADCKKKPFLLALLSLTTIPFKRTGVSNPFPNSNSWLVRLMVDSTAEMGDAVGLEVVGETLG